MKIGDATYIFGYGSLVNIEKLQYYLKREKMFSVDELFICKLKGFRRIWNVAMDNRNDLQGYKHYLEVKEDGKRIRSPYYVTFLNIEPYPNSEVLGVLFKVDRKMLARLLARERNYELLNISKYLDFESSPQAYAFVATSSGIQRFKQGIANNSAVISKEYFESVTGAYENLERKKVNLIKYFPNQYNEDFYRNFENTTYRDDLLSFKELLRVAS